MHRQENLGNYDSTTITLMFLNLEPILFCNYTLLYYTYVVLYFCIYSTIPFHDNL
jgi:hypothetical protein